MDDPRSLAGPHPLRHSGEIRDVPPPSGPTFFFLSYSTHGYGHLARSRRIASAFVAHASCDALVVSSHSDFPAGDTAARVSEISLPSSGLAAALEATGNATARGNPSPDAGVDGLLARRSQLLVDLVQRFRPRGILIDHFPFPPAKAAPECEGALARLRDQIPAPLLCAGFRGVFQRPFTAAEQHHILELFERYVDVFFVYVDPREEGDFADAHPFLRPVLPRTRFVGYVGPPPSAARPRAGRILAAFGAGIDAYPHVRLVCDAFRAFLRTHPQHTLDVVTGSRLPEAEYRMIEHRYGGTPEIRLTRVRPGLSGVLGEYELVVAMAGYNTLTELYQASARSIVLPRRVVAEQRRQATKFRRYGAVDRVYDAAVPSADALAALMEQVLSSAPPARQVIDVGGAITTARILAEELARPALAPSRRAVAGDATP